MREIDQLGGQPVAKLEAIRYEVIHRCAEPAQRPYADCARGGAVGVVVGDDQNLLLLLDCVGEQRSGARRVQQPVGRQQPRGVELELGRGADPPPGV